MAKKKSRKVKVDYKNLVREIRTTKKELEKIRKKVAKKDRKSIALQIKSLNYLAAVCKVKMSNSYILVPPRMSKCILVPPRMSKCPMTAKK
jgi:hypothetical protein